MPVLEGESYCIDHQGNHSHYDQHNCTVCKLTAAIAKHKVDVEAEQDGEPFQADLDLWKLI